MRHNLRDSKGRFCKAQVKEKEKVFIKKEDAITAYKVFNTDWTCKDFQYKVGESYKHKGEIKPCCSGFHCCENLFDCYTYYPFSHENKVAIVKVWGKVIKERDKLCASNIAIIEELNWYQVLDKVNTGKGNTSYLNKGSYNAGPRNIGNYNTGYYNRGSHNTGDFNIGNSNTSSYNSGHCNTGKYNKGNYNTGYYNSGNHNSGNINSGSYNTGCYNLGNYNTGRYNSGNNNTGMFNTAEQKTTFLFNKPVPMEVLFKVKLPAFLYFSTERWVPTKDMTKEEKKEHPEYEERGGYVKKLEYKEAFRESFLKAKKEPDWNKQLERLKAIPNFDADIFYEISGIKPEELK